MIRSVVPCACDSNIATIATVAVDFPPIKPLDEGTTAPVDAIPLNRGPMPQEPDGNDDDDGEEWGQDDVISIPGLLNANVEHAPHEPEDESESLRPKYPVDLAHGVSVGLVNDDDRMPPVRDPARMKQITELLDEALGDVFSTEYHASDYIGTKSNIGALILLRMAYDDWEDELVSDQLNLDATSPIPLEEQVLSILEKYSTRFLEAIANVKALRGKLDSRAPVMEDDNEETSSAELDISFPPLFIDIYDRRTGDRVGEKSYADDKRQVYCTFFNENSSNHIAIPRQPSEIVPPLLDGINYAEANESDEAPECDDLDESTDVDELEDLPESESLADSKSAICESFANVISGVGYGLVRVTYEPSAMWYDALDEGEQRQWPESRGNLFSWELLGDEDRHALDIGKGCIKAQLIEQLEAKIVRLRKACATIRGIKGELTIDRDEFVRAAVADGQEKFEAVQYGPVHEGTNSLAKELHALRQELATNGRDMHPATVNVVTGETTVHKQPAAPATASRFSWQTKVGAGESC